MALRDQPYLPLYIQDFLTDEKLAECSASATGVYIRLMCLMHKSEQYGMILLKQKDKQNPKQILNFAYKIAKHMPYNLHEIEDALSELITEGVLTIDGDCLFQKRMVKDCEISTKRSKAGKKGGDKSKNFASNFAQAKTQANAEYESEYNNDNDNNDKKGATSKINDEFESFRKAYPGVKRGYETEYKNLLKHSDWRIVIPNLMPALKNETQWRDGCHASGEFCPQWPHLRTWINQRRWEQELNEQQTKAAPGNKTQGERNYDEGF